MKTLMLWLLETDTEKAKDPANTFYSPGTIGFILTFFVAGSAVLIIFDMVRRVRRVRYRAEIQEKLDAEQAAAELAAKASAKRIKAD
jgi:hypothetical protein